MKYEQWIKEDFSWIVWRFAWIRKWENDVGSYTYNGKIEFMRIIFGFCVRVKP